MKDDTKKWMMGIIGAVVTGVVIFWLTQGMISTDHTNSGDSLTPSDTDIPTNTNLVVSGSANPWTIPTGGTTEIRVLVTNTENIPIEFANIRLGAGGGVFTSSGMVTVVGTTDRNGMFMTYWQAPSPAAPRYVLSVTATKTGFSKAEDLIYINIG